MPVFQPLTQGNLTQMYYQIFVTSETYLHVFEVFLQGIDPSV